MRLSSLVTVAAHRLHGAADRTAELAARTLRAAAGLTARQTGTRRIPEIAWPPADQRTSPYEGLYGRHPEAPDAGPDAAPARDPETTTPLDAAVPLGEEALRDRALFDRAAGAPAGTETIGYAGSTSSGAVPRPVIDTRAFAPRPASPRFRRWLPVTARSPLIGVPTAPATGGFDAPSLRTLLHCWPADGGSGAVPVPVPVLLAAPGAEHQVCRALPRGAGVVHPLVVTDPGGARRPVLLNALAAILEAADAPADSTDLPSGGTAWALEAEASGVPSLTVGSGQEHAVIEALQRWGRGPEGGGEPTEPWAGASRAARLRAAGRSVDHLMVPVAAAGPTTAPPEAPVVRVVHEPRRVVVAGHDLKFADPLIEHLRAAGHEVRLDHWGGHQRHDPAVSRRLAGWADAVLCEWTLGNALWYSHHTPRGTRLTTRLHLQEASLSFPGRVRQHSMDRFIFVADHIRRQVVRDHGIEFARTTVIPNAVSLPDGPAGEGPEQDSGGRRFTLGLVGIAPARKGLHRALDLVAGLRAQDPRFSLRIKGHLPSEHSWMAERTSEAPYYRAQFDRISRDPLLRDAVHFDPFGPDMDGWYRRIGVALSTSDFESFHFTLPDGAVRGAVPVSLAWPGADQLYPLEWLHPCVAAMSTRIQEIAADPGRWHQAGGRAAGLVAARYDARTVLPRLSREVLGG